MKRLVFDLDDTITRHDSAPTYPEKLPNLELVAKLREYKAAGFEIIIQSARNMQTYDNSIGKINARTLPGIIAWLQQHDIPFDEVFVGKPWCGHEGFYIDDRAIRPDEFISLSFDEIQALIRPGKR
jgi:capsule biosynthesis phosphatase